MSGGEAGFDDSQIATLEHLVPHLALAIKSVSLARMTRTLMETYLGRDAGQRVLSGRIVRGLAERIDAVVWFSDLRGFTRITDTTPEQMIPLLNDYSDVIVSAIHEHGGVERLDFTVLGPAVNEASRIAAMCRSVDQPVLMSAAFANVGDIKRWLISVGRYALRGVAHPQELFTFDPDA